MLVPHNMATTSDEWLCTSNFENNNFSADKFIIWILLGRDLAAALERKCFKRDVTAVKTTLDASEITKFRRELNLE